MVVEDDEVFSRGNGAEGDSLEQAGAVNTTAEASENSYDAVSATPSGFDEAAAAANSAASFALSPEPAVVRSDARHPTTMNRNGGAAGGAESGSGPLVAAGAEGAEGPSGGEAASFQVNERVSYWSDTHKQWMEAVVKVVNRDANDAITGYDLDVKRGAQASKIRRQIQPSQGAVGQGAGFAVAPAGANQPPAANADMQPPFMVNDRVEYWSDTYQQWMQAVVNRVRDGGTTYDLDVKRGAHRRKMRPGQPQQEPLLNRVASPDGLSVQVGAAPGSAALDHPVVVVPPVVSTQMLQQATRKPSPLSGRMRAAGAYDAAPVSISSGPGAVGGGGESTEREGADAGRPTINVAAGGRVGLDAGATPWSTVHSGAGPRLVQNPNESREMYHAGSGDSSAQSIGMDRPNGASVSGIAAASGVSVSTSAAQPGGMHGAPQKAGSKGEQLQIPLPPYGANSGGNMAYSNGAQGVYGSTAQGAAPANAMPHQIHRPSAGGAGGVSISVAAAGGATPMGGATPVTNTAAAAGGQQPGYSMPGVGAGGGYVAVGGGQAVVTGGQANAVAGGGIKVGHQTHTAATSSTAPGQSQVGEKAGVRYGNTAQQGQGQGFDANRNPLLFMGTGVERKPALNARANIAAQGQQQQRVSVAPGQQPQGQQAGTPPMINTPPGAPPGVASMVGAQQPGAAQGAAASGVPRQPPDPGGACGSGRAPTRALEVDELVFTVAPFDPLREPALRNQIVSQLGLGNRASMEAMQGFRGGLNEGVWFLSDPDRQPSGPSKDGRSRSGSEDLVLKLVRCHRIASGVLTEAENFIKIYKDHPGIVNDPCVAFPCKIFHCVGPTGQIANDLIVMRKVRGERLAEKIAHLWYRNQVPQLMQILQKLGGQLALYHGRYGKDGNSGNAQHGDFQPSNIFYDEESDQISLIDIGGMGVPTKDNDCDHFTNSLRLLSDAYGQRLSHEGLHHFNMGYQQNRGRR